MAEQHAQRPLLIPRSAVARPGEFQMRRRASAGVSLTAPGAGAAGPMGVL